MDDFTVNMSLTSPEINQSAVGALTGVKKGGTKSQGKFTYRHKSDSCLILWVLKS